MTERDTDMRPNRAIVVVMERRKRTVAERILSWLFPRRRIWQDLPRKSKIVLAIRK